MSQAQDPDRKAVENAALVRPSFVVGATALLHALIFGAAAFALPWESASSFGLSAGALAIGHTILCVAVWTRRPQARSVWRFVSLAAIVFAGVWAYLAASAGVYLAQLYGALGEGLGAAAAAAFAPVVLFTLPFALWGLAATRGASPRRGVKAAASVALLFASGGLVEACASPGSHASALPVDEQDALSLQLHGALRKVDLWNEISLQAAPSRVFNMSPAPCEASLADTDLATAFVTFVPKGAAEKQTGETRCVQAKEGALLDAVASLLASASQAGPAKIDFVSGWAHIDDAHPLVDGLKLRPGLDGACLGTACLMPWQLVASDQFTKFVPVSFIADLRVGFDPHYLAAQLGAPDPDSVGVEELLRVETHSYWIDAKAGVHALVRGRVPAPLVGPSQVRAAMLAAQNYILAAQQKDGRFHYKHDPFSGKIDRKNYNLPRQAGTTLVLCEIGEFEDEVDRVIARSLRFMRKRGRKHGAMSFLSKSSKAKRASLGATALPLIAFAACRERVGDGHDKLMGALANGLLAMQNEDGSFAGAFDRKQERALAGPEPLFAAGQVIFALSLMEKIEAQAHAQGKTTPLPGWPSQAQLHEAVERAMDHYAGPYWAHALRQFFWVEENWHCLAARASLGHHRHDAYERMCLDYLRYKRRLVLDGDSRVAFDFVGGYGFGNVIPPHNTGTAGYGEAAAAGIEIARARGSESAWLEADLEAAHAFLLRQQWSAANDFATDPRVSVRGAFSESMGSPVIRIDYVQHAMAALGHGARVLHADAGTASEPVDEAP